MAKYYFPAIFTPEAEGYSISFPNLENCYTQGDDLQDAYEMAKDVLCLTLYRMEEENKPIPTPSLPIGQPDNGGFYALISCDTLEYRKLNQNKAVKKTLTIPSWLNAMAEREGINFSAALQNALKHELNFDDRA